MFQHQGDIFKHFIKNKGSYVQHVDAITFIIRIKVLKC